MLAEVAHRHVVLTIPRLLRPLLRRRRELLTELGGAAAEAVAELVRRDLGGEARPGLVVSIATAGDLVQWHPHVHLLTTDAGRTADGSWQPLPEWSATLLMSLFRERLLARLVEAHAISPELVKKLLAWRHPGFSAHVGERNHVDPLVCARCGQRMSLIAFVTDQMAIGKILDHLGLRSPETAKPPPPARERLRVAEHGHGWGTPQQWDPA